MDLTVVAAAVFVAAAVVSFFLRRINYERRRVAAPLLPPVVGVACALAALPTLVAKGLPAVIRDLHAKLGSVFTLHLFFGLKEVTFLVGPEVTAHFFQGSESEIGQSDVYKVTVPVFGPGVCYDVDPPTRRRQISFCADAVKPVNLRSHVGSMVSEVEDFFARWGEHGTVDLKHELGHVLMRIASRCMLGEENRDTSKFEQVSLLLHELFDNGFHLASLFFPRLPIGPHRRRDRARAKIGEIFHDAVRSRREDSSSSSSSSGRSRNNDDVLQRLIDSRYISGRAMTESEIAGLLICMLFAGQHTSSSASVWTGACLLLLSRRRYLEAAVEEQRNIIGRHGPERVDYGVLSEMTTLHCCIKEAMRMHPPATLLIRHASKSFTVDSREGNRYEIPGGHTLVSSPAVANRLPYIYKDPDVYDPSRFGPGREEDRVGGKFSYTAFSAGRHVCLGEDYAYVQIKVIWAYLLRNFELEMVSPFPEEEREKFIPGPRGEVMVRYKRRLLN